MKGNRRQRREARRRKEMPPEQRKGFHKGAFEARPEHPRCPENGKLRYTTALAAERMLASAIVNGSGKQRPRRAYLCKVCDGWHLTSAERRIPGEMVNTTRSYPDTITSPIDPPTVSGTEVTRPLP